MTILSSLLLPSEVQDKMQVLPGFTISNPCELKLLLHILRVGTTNQTKPMQTSGPVRVQRFQTNP